VHNSSKQEPPQGMIKGKGNIIYSSTSKRRHNEGKGGGVCLQLSTGKKIYACKGNKQSR